MSRAGGSHSMETQKQQHQTSPAHFYPWSMASPWVIQEFGSHQSDATKPQASHPQALQAWLCLFERSHTSTENKSAQNTGKPPPVSYLRELFLSPMGYFCSLTTLRTEKIWLAIPEHSHVSGRKCERGVLTYPRADHRQK